MSVFSKVDTNQQWTDRCLRDPANQNLVKYIPSSKYLFTVKKAKAKYKSKKVINPYLQDFEEITEKYLEYIPAKLNEEVGFKDFAKYYKPGIIPHPDLWPAYQVFKGFTHQFLKPFQPMPLREVFHDTQWDTSKGAFWGFSQLQHNPLFGEKDKLIYEQWFWDYDAEWEESLVSDDPEWCVFAVSEKDELRLKSKVEEDKTRTINAAPFEHTLACAKELGNLHKQLLEWGLKTRMLYGFSPYLGGWNRLIKILKDFLYANGTDASQYDSSIREMFFALFIDWIESLLPFDASWERSFIVAI
nr:MAG: RNA-dependent RNA polymerase [Astroviridae sp.]